MTKRENKKEIENRKINGMKIKEKKRKENRKN